MTESAGDHQDLHSDRTTTFVEDDVISDEAAENLEDFESAGDPDELPARRGREGLPPAFRMRHDAHYVDELTRSSPAIRQIAVTEIDRDLVTTAGPQPVVDLLADSIRRAGVLQPLLVVAARGRFQLIDGARRLQAAVQAGLRHVPCIVHEVDDTAAHQMRGNVNVREASDGIAEDAGQPLIPGAASDLAAMLELAEAQAAICARSAAGFKSVAAADVLQAELSRAARVARAAAIMVEAPRLRRSEITARRVVERAALATAVARRLAGVALDISIDNPEFRIPADPLLVTQALAGAINVMVALGDEARREDADGDSDAETFAARALTISLQCVKTRPAIIIELAQRAVSVEPELIGHFFDASSTLHPGGPSSALLLAAAARIVRAHGGRADVRRDGAVGCTVTFVLPQSTARAADM